MRASSPKLTKIPNCLIVMPCTTVFICMIHKGLMQGVKYKEDNFFSDDLEP